MAAARFSRQCGEIQKAHVGKALGAFFDEQIACVSATIMLSVASLESNINEHLEDAHQVLPDLPEGARKQFRELLGPLPILEKYDRVLAIRGLPKFDRGAPQYQDADLLISIRNELVHFHPEWHHDQERHRKLGKRILYKFELSPFIAERSGVIFPQRFVSHGCTKWAVESALKFMEAFALMSGVQSRFAQHKEHFNA